MILIDSDLDKTHNFEMISGIITGFLFPSLGCTRDIIFLKNENYKVKIMLKITKQKREFSIKGKRLMLINYNYDYPLYINNILITNEIMNSYPQRESSQISVVGLKNRVFLFKSISPQQFDLFLKAYDKYKGEAIYFFESINEFLAKKRKKFNYDEYKALFFK